MLEYNKKLVTIVIPTYEMHGYGMHFLNFNLEKIYKQTYNNLEIVISDHSKDDRIERVCKNWGKKLNIKYLKYEFNFGNSSANLNNAIKNSSGEYIKILFQDDFFYDDFSLENTILEFDNNKNKNWLVSTCQHTNDGINFNREFVPMYNSEIHYGNNTISSPSVLTIRNNSLEFFNENLVWLMDVEYYKRLYDKFGDPIILNKITVVNRIWEKQYTNIIDHTAKEKELEYIKIKYGEK